MADGLTPVHDKAGKLVARVPIGPRDLASIDKTGRIVITYDIRTDNFFDHPAFGGNGSAVGAFDVTRTPEGRYVTGSPGELTRYVQARERRARNMTKV